MEAQKRETLAHNHRLSQEQRWMPNLGLTLKLMLTLHCTSLSQNINFHVTLPPYCAFRERPTDLISWWLTLHLANSQIFIQSINTWNKMRIHKHLTRKGCEIGFAVQVWYKNYYKVVNIMTFLIHVNGNPNSLRVQSYHMKLSRQSLCLFKLVAENRVLLFKFPLYSEYLSTILGGLGLDQVQRPSQNQAIPDRCLYFIRFRDLVWGGEKAQMSEDGTSPWKSPPIWWVLIYITRKYWDDNIPILLWTELCPSQNSYVEAQIHNVTIFGNMEIRKVKWGHNGKAFIWYD